MSTKTVHIDDLSGEEFDWALIRAAYPDARAELTECGVQAFFDLHDFGETKLSTMLLFSMYEAAPAEEIDKALTQIRAAFGDTVQVPADRSRCNYRAEHVPGEHCKDKLIPRKQP